MEAKILITGATGNVGSQVAAQLCERGVPPVAVVHSADKAAAVKAHCAEVRVADLRDEQQVASVFEGIDKVFLVTPATPDQLEIGDRLIAAADAAGVDHVVKLSIIGAEYEPGILLGRWHRHMENDRAQRYAGPSCVPTATCRTTSRPGARRSGRKARSTCPWGTVP